MKNDDYCAIIRSGLQQIIGEVSADAGANLHSINIHAESFFREFLNLLFGWELRNANADEPNAAGIDLLYPGGNVVVQVSSTYTKRKILHSLEESGKYKGSHFYFAAISNEAHSFSFTEKEKNGLIFEPAEDILTPKRLQQIIVEERGVEQQRELAALTERFVGGREQRVRLKPLGSRSTRTGFEFNFEVEGRPVVPFVGRGAELEDLLDFVRGDDAVPFHWWAITAPGGAGKSRLAYELQRELLRLGGWDVRAVPGSVLQSEEGLLGLADAFPGKTLFLVDYVQQYTKALRKWFQTLADPDSDRTAPLRVLLLERDVRDADGRYPWLEQLFEADTRMEAAFFAEDDRPMELKPLAPAAEDEADPLLRVIRSFADSVFDRGVKAGEQGLTRLPEGKETELRAKLDQLDPRLVRPLFAMILADAWVHDPKALRWNQDKLLKETVLREQNFLTKRLEPYGGDENPKLPGAALQLLAIATVLGAGDGVLPLSGLAELKCGKILAEFGRLNGKLLAGKGADPTEALLTEAGLWAEGALLPLRPDLLGEFFVLERMKRLGQEAADFFAAILSKPDAAIIFFLRVLRDYGERVLTKAAGQAEPVYADWLFPAGLRLDDERKGWLVRLLITLFKGASPEEEAPGGARGGHVGADTEAKKRWLLDRMAGYVSAMGDQATDNYAAACSDLGRAYQDRGEYGKALEFHQRALKILEKVLGPEHPSTAATCDNLGLVYRAMGDLPKALELHQKALTIREKVLGPEHSDTAATCDNLGLAYRAMGDLPKALEFHQRALEIEEKVLGPEHPDTAATCNNLGSVYFTMGDYPKALEFYQRALNIKKKVLGPEHPDTAKACDGLGLVYQHMGDLQKALEFHQRALKIREKVLGPEHPDTAATCNNLGVVYQRMGDYPQALDFHQRALKIREKILGPEHPDTAITCFNIGGLYLRQQKPGEALPWLRRALAAFRAVLGSEHPYTQKAQNQLQYAEMLAALEQAFGAEGLAELLRAAQQTDGEEEEQETPP